MHPPVKKVVLFFFILVCFVLSLHFSEGKTTIVRVKKPKHLIGPKHIQSLVKLNHGVYAREFAYEKPLSNFVLRRRNSRQLRKKRKAKKKVRIVAPWKGGLKNYARKYKTWAPSKEFISGNQIVIDTIEPRPNKKRRRPAPIIIDDDLITETSKKRRRVRPNRPPGGPHRPFPPDQDIIYDEYEGVDYFPEETKRLEIDYDVDDRYRPSGKKPRRPPGLRKKKIKKPELNSRFPFDDDNHLTPDGRYKPSIKEPTISYSNFIQHPSSSIRGETDYDYPEEDDSRFVRNESKKKRRRVKKKSNSRDKKRDKNNYRPAESEEDIRIPSYVSDAERYQYQLSEEQEYQRNPPKPKRNKQRYESNTVYGDGHISTNNQIDDTRYAGNFVRAPSRPDLQNFQQNTFSPAYSRPAQQIPQPFAHPIYENNNFDQQGNGNRYNQINNRPNLQQSIPVVNNFNPSNAYSGSNSPFIKNQINPFDQQNSYPSNNYSPNNGYSTQLSSGTYQQPVYTRNTVSNSGGNSFPNNFKSSPVFDNTESFYDFNNNANVNSQQSKQNFLASSSDYLQKYSSSNRLNTVVPSNSDPDNEFIAKHQNLYNNGISGVPIQGDGFGNSRINHQNKNKDFDIGYGEFQFDENPNV